MGRQQYLTRLALGRSPYQPVDDEQIHHAGASVAEEGDSASDDYVQQYDTKGRPTNPATDARNAEMRRAQNSILALVGVVEDRERSERTTGLDARRARDARRVLLAAEDDLGAVLDLFISIFQQLSSWWAGNLLRRYQAGIYDSRRPLVDVIRGQWSPVFSGGGRGLYAALLPGSAAWVVFAGARMSIYAAIDAATERVSELIWPQLRRTGTQKKVDNLLQYAEVTLKRLGDVLLLPIAYYAATQQLGIAPAMPLLPPIRYLLFSEASFLRSSAWEPLIRAPIFGSFCSPAALLLARTLLLYDAASEDEQPLADGLANFRYPAINESGLTVEEPQLLRDPLGWVLHKAYTVRASMLEWCGWNVITLGTPTSDGELWNDVTVQLDVISAHRSTALAHLPAQFLASRIDDLFVSLLTLPFDCLVYRAVATSYLAASLPKTDKPLVAGSTVFTVFSGSTPHQIASLEPFGEAAPPLVSYLGKICLSIALLSALDAAVFAGLYGLVRWQAVRNFGWGDTNGSGRTRRASQS